ncbi:MAG: RDD family protein [Bacteroidota bacterium]
MKDFYKTLNIDRDASANEIESAYACLKDRLQTNSGKDLYTGFGEADELHEAYAVLSNESARANYDKLRAINARFVDDEQEGTGISNAHNTLPKIIEFKAEPAIAYPDQYITLTWKTRDADSVTISGLGPVAGSGTAKLNLRGLLTGEFSALELKARDAETGKLFTDETIISNLIYNEINIKLKHIDYTYKKAKNKSQLSVSNYLFDKSVYAEFITRGLAFIIDLVISILFYFSLAFLLNTLFAESFTSAGSVVLVYIPLVFAYRIYTEYCFNATAGKLIMGSVVTEAGSLSMKPTFKQILFRNLVFIIGYLFIGLQILLSDKVIIVLFFHLGIYGFLFVEIIFFIKNTNGRTLHDLAGGTAVINKYYLHKNYKEWLKTNR